jgi:hypothetical protein
MQPPGQPHPGASAAPAELEVGVAQYPPPGASLVPLWVIVREPTGRLARADPHTGSHLRVKPGEFRTKASAPLLEEAVHGSLLSESPPPSLGARPTRRVRSLRGSGHLPDCSTGCQGCTAVRLQQWAIWPTRCDATEFRSGLVPATTTVLSLPLLLLAHPGAHAYPGTHREAAH